MNTIEQGGAAKALPDDHDWRNVGYWFRCEKCGQWQDVEPTPKCLPVAKNAGPE